VKKHIAAAKEFVVKVINKQPLLSLKNAIQLDPKQAEARFELGNLYLEQKNYQAAEKETQPCTGARLFAIKNNSTSSQSLSAAPEQNAALEEIDHDMGWSNVFREAEVGYYKAQSLIQLNKTDEALVLIQELMQLDTSSVYKGLAWCP